MFTGIIEELGSIKKIEPISTGSQFTIEASKILQDIKIGDSIAVNGCCLTVTNSDLSSWTCHAIEETLKKTNLSSLQVGQCVNLERAVRLQDRLGGHLVQGHVDEIGCIQKKELLPDQSWILSIAATPAALRYLVPKGSITLDGVSLTIIDVKDDFFTFGMIPHTAKVTTLGSKKEGDTINIEIDLLAKYVERLYQPLVQGEPKI